MHSTQKTQQLADLYNEEHTCVKCSIGGNPTTVTRQITQKSINSKVFLVGQALAENTQRLSGIPYVKIGGKLSATGDKLNKFLNLFGYTVDPADNVNQGVYSSDTVLCFTERNIFGSGDRKPNSQEIKNCFSQRFLLNEIKIVEPKLLLLLGNVSRDAFNKWLLNGKLEKLEQIIDKGMITKFTIQNLDLYVLPLCHPSAHGDLFNRTINNKELIALIKGVLL